MMEPRFIFRLTSYHTDKLLPQVSRALELRNEIVSRAKYPFLWKRKDKLKAKGKERPGRARQRAAPTTRPQESCSRARTSCAPRTTSGYSFTTRA